MLGKSKGNKMKSIALLIVAFLLFGIAILRSKPNQKLIDNSVYALYSLTTGSQNTANGYRSLNALTPKTVNGCRALYSNTIKSCGEESYLPMNSNTKIRKEIK